MSAKERTKKGKSKVSVGGWMGTLVLSAIPVVNLVMWFIWAFRAKKPSRKTFAIACLILTAICLALSAAAIAVWGTQILEWARQLNPNLVSDALNANG